ncbi:MAG TPA: NAD(P)-binding protein [bacterium]|nr:NAD(P)-binding protein [bacterium]
MAERAAVVVLGAGLAGLAAAGVLGDRAVVLEREPRPGGLVRTEEWGGYWFDHVLHLLYFGADRTTENRILDLVGRDVMRAMRPDAWVETVHGTVRYPFQMHLGGLPTEIVVSCLRDLAQVTFGPHTEAPADFTSMLDQTFGRAMCEAFLFPYNRKMWRRPLESLAPSGFQWTITHPDFDGVVRGALEKDQDFATYNAQSWYPVPPGGAPVRGMEVLAVALAGQVRDLRLHHEILEIDLDRRVVTARHAGNELEFAYGEGLCSTLPLPQTVALCKQAPAELREACRTLVRNRVYSASFSIRGPRPENRGLWRYYSDETLIFTRLIYPHHFDEFSAPPDGWGLLAEITEPAEQPRQADAAVLDRCQEDIALAGALPQGCEVIDRHLIVADPAYVVFTVENQPVMEAARTFLRSHGIEPLGRYGRWEYSSMAQVMRDGLAWGEALLAGQAQAAGVVAP